MRLLLLLTVADIRAVGPNVWNNWKASLLRELYFATEAHLSGGHEATGREDRIEGAKYAVREMLATSPEGVLEKFMKLGYPSYWLSLDTATHVRNAKFVGSAEKSGEALSFDIHVDEVNDVTELTIYTADHPGLFSRIAGAMAVSGANIVGAKIFTMTNGMALDSFSIQDSAGSAYANKRQLKRLKGRVEKTLHGEFSPEHGLPCPVTTSRTGTPVS